MLSLYNTVGHNSMTFISNLVTNIRVMFVGHNSEGGPI